MASGLYRRLANRLDDHIHRAEPASLFRKFVQTDATVTICQDRIEVTLSRRSCNPYLLKAGYADFPTAILCCTIAF